MSTGDGPLFGRKASLVVTKGQQGLDLSDFKFRFKTSQADAESPNSCVVRVWNIAPSSLTKLQVEGSLLTLQAGYGSAAFGVVFQGTVRQMRINRDNAKDSWVEFLVADGDQAYNFAFLNQTFEAGSTPEQRVRAAIAAMAPYGVNPGSIDLGTGGTIPNPRGKVVFGMARALLRAEAEGNGCTWNISNGLVNVVPLTGYLPGMAVVLNAQTGLIGQPEQTEEGVNAISLTNPRIQPGQLVKINNNEINRTVTLDSAQHTPYNSWTRMQNLASIAADGLYRAYVVEHEGDTRGREWYTRLVCLKVERDTQEVKPYG